MKHEQKDISNAARKWKRGNKTKHHKLLSRNGEYAKPGKKFRSASIEGGEASADNNFETVHKID